MLNTMVSFVILLIARTARIACADRHIDTHTHGTTTITVAAHAHRGLMNLLCSKMLYVHSEMLYTNSAAKTALHILNESFSVKTENSNVMLTLRGFRWYPYFVAPE